MAQAQTDTLGRQNVTLEPSGNGQEGKEVRAVDPRMWVTDNSEFSNLLDSARFAHLQRLATLFSNSKLVPEHFRGDMPSTFVGMQMALRLQVDPMMFLQSSYIVHGRPGIEGKLAIALINRSGIFEGPVQWRFTGQPKTPEWACTAYAKHKKAGEICEVSVSWQMAKDEGWIDKKGSKWLTMPDMMFRYRSATFLGRLYCPEVLMGLNLVDELREMPEERDISEHVTIVRGNAGQVFPTEEDLWTSLRGAITASSKPDLAKDKRLPEFVAETASALQTSKDDVLSGALNNLADFLTAFEGWIGEQGQEQAKAEAKPAEQAADAPKKRQRRTRISLDGMPANTCGITEAQITELRTLAERAPECTDLIQEALDGIGYDDMSFLAEPEASELIGKCKALVGEKSPPKQAMPETVTCPKESLAKTRGAVVRTHIECKFCDYRKGCIALPEEK